MPRLHVVLTRLIALVWLANGLLCKLLGFVPRHAAIVARILGPAHADLLTKAIGVAEIGMAIWVISRIKSRWSAVAQLVLIGTMNTLEFVLAPDLLLWGHANAAFAALFMGLIYYNEFVLGRNHAAGGRAEPAETARRQQKV